MPARYPALGRPSLRRAVRSAVETLESRRLLAAITSGQTLTGTLADEAEIEFTFSADAGDYLAITYSETSADESFDSDPRLTLFAPDGTTLSTPSSVNVGVTTLLAAPQTGTYTYTIVDFDAGDNAPIGYATSLVVGRGEADAVDANSGPIRSGETRRFDLTPGGLAGYTFFADAGDHIAVAVSEKGADETFDVDVYLRLVAPDGTAIATPSSANDGDVVLRDAPLSGLYTIIVGDFDGSANPPEPIDLSLVVGRGETDPPDVDSGVIRSGSAVPITLDDGLLTNYFFDADAGDDITIALSELGSDETFDVDPFLRLISPDGTAIATPSSANDGLTVVRTAPLSGTYTILVGDLDPGRVEPEPAVLSLILARGEADPVDDDTDFIASGETRRLTLGDGRLANFFFNASAGDDIGISLGELGVDETFDVDGFLRLIGPDGTALATPSSANDGLTVSRSAPLSGLYTIVVGDLDPGRTPDIDFNLSLGLGNGVAVPADLPGGLTSGPIVSGQTINDSLPEGGLLVYTFAANQGDEVTAVLREEAADETFDFDPYLRLIGPDGSAIATPSSANEEVTITRTLPLTGIYTLIGGDLDPGRVLPLTPFSLTLNGATGTANQPPTVTSLTASPNPAQVGESFVLTASGVADSDGTVDRVEFYQVSGAADVLLGIDSDPSDGFTFNQGPFLSATTQPYAARAFDDDGAAGNRVTTTVTIEDAVIVPNVPPTIGGFAVVPSQAFVGDTATLTATGLADADGIVAGVEFFSLTAPSGDPQRISLGTATPVNGTATLDVPAPVLGLFAFAVVATDDDGAASAESTATLSVLERPNTPATIAALVDSPDPVAPGGTITLTAQGVADAESSFTIVEFFRQVGDRDVLGDVSGPAGDDVLVGSVSDASGDVSVTVDVTGLSDGTYTYYATAFEPGVNVGGTASTTNTVASDPPPPDNVAPSLASLAASPEPVTRGNPLTLTAGGVGDSDGTVVRVDFFRDTTDGPVNVGFDTDGSDGWSITVDTASLAAGPYVYSAFATDDDGATSPTRTTSSTVVEIVPPPPGDLAFTFLDADADTRLFQIADGATYNRSELAANLSVEADGVDVDAESVRFRLIGPGGLAFESTENVSFYTLFSNQGGDYAGSTQALGGQLAAGTYTLTATAYAGDNAAGAVGETASVTFTIVDDTIGDGPAIESVSLIDAEGDAIVRQLAKGDVIDVADVPARPSILAIVADPSQVESVRLSLVGPNGLAVERVEEILPYTLFANDGDDFFGNGMFGVGVYTLTVTPFGGPAATGEAGETLSITFTIVDGAAVA